MHDIELGSSGDIVLLDGLPGDTPGRFAGDGAGMPDPMLSFSYPENGAALPANLPSLTFRWGEPKKMAPEKIPSDERIFELTLATPSHSLRMYTTELSAAVPRDHWLRLLRAGPDQDLTVQLRSADADGKRRSGKPISLPLRAPLSDGLIYFWSETEKMVKRTALENPQVELVAAPSEAQCLGCWSVAMDGAHLLTIGERGEVAVSSLETGERTPFLGTVDQASVQTCDVASEGHSAVVVASSASSFHRVEQPPFVLADLTSFAFAADGASALYVRSSPWPTMPGENAERLEQAQLAPSGELLEARLLTHSDKADEGIRHPSSDRQNQLLTFERTKGPDGRETALAIMRLDDSKVVILDKGSKRDAWPSLADAEAPDERWLLFSAQRDGPEGKLSPGQAQLWMWNVRIAPDGSLEPAAAPICLPYQDAESSNARPQWRPALR